MIDSSRSTLWSQLVQWGSALALLAIMGGCGSSGSSTSPSWKTNTGYVLQPRFEEGSSYAVETTMDQTMNMVVMGRSLEVDQQQSMVHRYDVRDRAADGTITLDYTTTRVRGQTSMPAMGRSMSYDSEDTTASGQAGRMSRRMRSMTGHTISARLSPQGSVHAVTGVEALLDSLAAVEQDSTQAQVLRRMMGPDAVRQQLNLSFGVYPDRPVSVGDTWTDESAVRLGVPMQIKATYTLDSIRSTQAVIDARMDLSPVEGDSTIQMGGMSMKMNLTGDMEGKILLDVPSGLPSESTLRMEMSGTGTVERGPATQGSSMEMELKSEGTIERKIRAREKER